MKERVFLIDASRVHNNCPFIAQPVGLLSMAAVLREQGHPVAVHDCKLDETSLPQRLLEFAPDVVGLRGLTIFADLLQELTAQIRKLLPGTPVVIGGPYPTTHPEEALRSTGADVAVLSEGEVTLQELLPAVLENGPYDEIHGLAWLEDNTLRLSDPRPPIDDLDSLPMPAYDLLPIEQYFQKVRATTAPHGRTITMVTTRGCPYGCSFCHNIFGRNFRARSAERVVDEIRFLQRRYGLEEIELHDDCFNLRRNRTLEFSNRMASARIPVKLAFPNGLRGDLLDRTVLTALREAGTHHLCLAPETASQRLQKLLGKNMDLDKVLRAAEISVGLGIFTQGYFMMGFPGETEEELLATADMACNTRLHIASFNVVNPVPGTRLWQQAIDSGRLAGEPGIRGYAQTNRNLTDVSDERFEAIWKGAYRRFYLNPRRALSIVRDITSRRLLVRNGVFMFRRLL